METIISLLVISNISTHFRIDQPEVSSMKWNSWHYDLHKILKWHGPKDHLENTLTNECLLDGAYKFLSNLCPIRRPGAKHFLSSSIQKIGLCCRLSFLGVPVEQKLIIWKQFSKLIHERHLYPWPPTYSFYFLLNQNHARCTSHNAVN